jgi:hypothetical protein
MSWRPERDPAVVARLGRPLATRAEFLGDLGRAVSEGRGFAAGKIGASEKHWMYYPLVLERGPHAARRRVFERLLLFHGLKQSGLFPPNPEFYLNYNRQYVAAVREMDSLGVFLNPVEMERELVAFYGLENRLIFYAEQEPDRSTPSDEGNCYVPFFAGKRLLLVCPFAEVLKAQASRERFEGVWAKTGKRWFAPASVEALEFPYGFEHATRARYATCLDLLDEIKGRVARLDFDVALIAAGGLAIPLAAFVKGLGRVGLSLGGSLQVLFGVRGKRWRDEEGWRRRYFNEWWVDVPPHYRPLETGVCDDGAYW